MDFRENMGRTKETLGAYWRHGLRELGGALYGPGTVAQHAEYGMPGTKLPSEISESHRTDVGNSREQQDTTLSREMERATSREVSEPDRNEIDRDM